MLYFEDGQLSSLADFPMHGKARPLPLSDARSIGGQILKCKMCVHKLGNVHQVLKPAKVLLRSQEEPVGAVIYDHGFAQESSKTMTWVGSRLWSAPECLGANTVELLGSKSHVATKCVCRG